jgi:putative copper resistance protein D
MEEALYACRFVQFTSAIVLFGTVSFRYYAIAGSSEPATSIVAAFAAWISQLILAAAVTALVSALALLLCETAAMAASPAAAIDPAALSAVLFETRFGRVWTCRLLFALLLVLGGLARSRTRPSVMLILSLLLLASLAWTGHAVIAGLAHELNQAVHLLAAGLWLGGLVPLGWLLRRVRAAPDAATVVLTGEAVRHFSQMGYAAVTLIALTGVFNTVLLVDGLAAMLSTQYGRLLAGKILLFLAMVVIALVNRFRLAPRISSEPAALGALCRTVGLEQGLGLLILAVVSVLGTWPPAIHLGGP